MCTLFEEREDSSTKAAKKTTKYLIFALWGIYEYLSVPISRLFFGAPISPMTGLMWLSGTLSYSRHAFVSLLGVVIGFYFVFIILCLFLGSLFFIAEKIEDLLTRAIVSILFLFFVAVFPVLLFVFLALIR